MAQQYAKHIKRKTPNRSVGRKQFKTHIAMKKILGGEESDVPPVESMADIGPLDPDKFLRTMAKERAKTLGRKIKENQDDDYFVVPTYKTAVIRSYDKLPKSFKRKAMLMYAKGCSDAEIQAVFGILPSSWEEWLTAYPDFADTVALGNARAKAWWERNARQYVTQPQAKFNGGLWYMNMKNRYGYKDEKSVEHKGQVQHAFVALPPVEDQRSLPPGKIIDAPDVD